MFSFTFRNLSCVIAHRQTLTGFNGSIEEASPLGDQLGESFSGCRCAQDVPDILAGRDIEARALRRLADRRQPLLHDRTTAGLP